MSRSYTSSPPKRLHGVQRDCFTFTFRLLANTLSSQLMLINLKIKIYKPVINTVVLCDGEIWVLRLNDEHRQRVFENGVLTRRYMTTDWRKLHIEKLLEL
jgi:hypothetical protein